MKKIVLACLSLVLVFALTGCMPSNTTNATAKVDLVLPTKAGAESGQEELDIPQVTDADYEDTIEGLCQYLEAGYAVADEKVQMSYDVIDAVDGYRYLFRYNKTGVQVEVYAYDLQNLTDAAKQNLAKLKETGKLQIVEREVDAVLSDNGKYVMLYQDGNQAEANTAQKERVIALFKAFHK